jgi:hypothetical protein
MEGQSSGAKRSPQAGDELAPKHFAEHLHRKKESVTWANPGGLIESEPSRWNDAVNMGMMLQVLSPCMENAQEADLGPEMTRVCRNLQERRRAGTEQQIVKNAFVLLSDRGELVRNREHNM